MTTLITDGFDEGRVKCTCGHDDEPLVMHDGDCAIVLDALAEWEYFEWYLGENDE